MARTCIFCGQPAGSKEHVFPNWLNSVLPSLAAGEKAEWGYSESKPAAEFELRSWTKPNIASQVTKHVCHDCNTGWMAEMEGRIKPLITPLILGQSKTFSRHEQIEIGRWAVKTAMVLEMTNRDANHFPFEQTQLMHGKNGISPPHLCVFSGAVIGDIPPIGFYYMGAASPEDWPISMTVHFYTIQMGTLVLQVCRPDPLIPEYNVWNESPLALDRELSLIPPLPSHTWPPKAPMEMSDLLDYSRRGIPVPEGWRVGAVEVLNLASEGTDTSTNNIVE